MEYPENHILLFDGECNLCNGLVQFVIKIDAKEKFKFASLQSEYGQLLLKKFGLPPDDLDSFVFIRGNKYFLRSTAGLNLLKESGGVWKLFYALIIFPESLRDFVYNYIAKKRYKIFGKRQTCMIPTLEIKQRFLI